MPKVATITQEIIVNAAFEMIRTNGFSSLTARNIAKKIGCSTQPIYWVYKKIDDVKQEVIIKMTHYIRDFITSYKKTGKPLLDLGLAYVRLSYLEPIIFKAVYVENILNITLTNIIPDEILLHAMEEDECTSHISLEKRKELAIHAGIFVHGLASLIAAGMIVYDEDKIEQLIISEL